MKVLVIRANPRKNGHTQKLTDLFIEGLNQGKATVNEVDLSRKNINQCQGCYSCWLTTPGKCIHKDDMTFIMKDFCSSDIVVFSSPLYIYGISGYLKVFFDRLLPYMKNEHAKTPLDNIQNLIRDPDKWPKKMAYILVGAFKGMDTFSGAKKTLELFAEGLSLPLAGGLIRPESYFLPFIYLKPKTVRLVKSAFKTAGFELATKGKIGDDIIKNASAPLSENIEHFIEDSNIYWQEALSLGDKAKDLDLVSDLIVRNPRILLSEMVRHIDPKATAKMKAVIQFEFCDKNLHFKIEVNKGECALEESENKKADLRITTDTNTWAQIFLREINATKALIERKIILQGDKSIFARLDKYFPLPFD